MKKHFISNLDTYLEPFIQERVEEILLEVERTPERFPEYAERDAKLTEAKAAFVEQHNGIDIELDDIVSLVRLCNAHLMRELYWQGVQDCAEMLRKLLIFPEGHEKEDA